MKLLNLFDNNMVCHYTNCEKAISILLCGQLKLSPIGCCRDPRENKKWNFDFIGGMQRHCDENRKILTEFDSLIKTKSKVLCFCGWDNDELNFSGNAIPEEREEYYRVGFARPRMWAQYGEEHKGVCLVFSRKKLESQFNSHFNSYKKYANEVEYQYHLQEFVTARKINCDDIIIRGIDYVFDSQLDKHHHEYFFLKHRDYRDEKEYRLVVISDAPAFLPISESLVAIVVGVDFPTGEYSAIADLAGTGVERHILTWQEGRPQLDP